MTVPQPKPFYPTREDILSSLRRRLETRLEDSPLSLTSITSDGTWVTANGPSDLSYLQDLSPKSYPTNTERPSSISSPSTSKYQTPLYKSYTQMPEDSDETLSSSNTSVIIGLQSLANTFSRLGNSISNLAIGTTSLNEMNRMIEEFEELPDTIARVTAAMLSQVERSVTELHIRMTARHMADNCGGNLGSSAKRVRIQAPNAAPSEESTPTLARHPSPSPPSSPSVRSSSPWGHEVASDSDEEVPPKSSTSTKYRTPPALNHTPAPATPIAPRLKIIPLPEVPHRNDWWTYNTPSSVPMVLESPTPFRRRNAGSSNSSASFSPSLNDLALGVSGVPGPLPELRPRR